MKLHEILEATFRKDLENTELQPVLLSPLKYFYRPTIWLSVSTWAIVTIYFFTPPISISIQLARGVSPIKYRLPFPSQYPWAVEGNSILYPTQYFIEVCAGLGLAGITAATDALFGFYIFQMSSQFRTLSYRMNNLKSADNHLAVMKECAGRHRTLTLCRDYLERIYGPIILWMLMTSAMTMCANIFQASQISFDKAILVMVYIVMKLMQTLLYGWYGLFLTTESEVFRESVYCSGWAGSGDKSFMSNVLIMLMYKPLVLTACHFSVISLDIFMAVGILNISIKVLLIFLQT
nr:olfactory receptor 85 [Gregopimpla kuwanae]